MARSPVCLKMKLQIMSKIICRGKVPHVSQTAGADREQDHVSRQGPPCVSNCRRRSRARSFVMARSPMCLKQKLQIMSKIICHGNVSAHCCLTLSIHPQHFPCIPQPDTSAHVHLNKTDQIIQLQSLAHRNSWPSAVTRVLPLERVHCIAPSKEKVNYAGIDNHSPR